MRRSIFRARTFGALVAAVLFAGAAQAAEPSCETLNRLYDNRYVGDFAIDWETFEIGFSLPLFDCVEGDKNYVLAKAIYDLERLRPSSENEPDWYAEVSALLVEPGNMIRYIPEINLAPNSTARTVRDGDQAAIFILDAYVHSTERLRPAYVLVHEAFHLRRDDPGHVVCVAGVNAGKRVCDERLGGPATLSRGSGNSHEFLFLLDVRDSVAATPEMKRNAQQQLQYLADNMFNSVDADASHRYGLKNR